MQLSDGSRQLSVLSVLLVLSQLHSLVLTTAVTQAEFVRRDQLCDDDVYMANHCSSQGRTDSGARCAVLCLLQLTCVGWLWDGQCVLCEERANDTACNSYTAASSDVLVYWLNTCESEEETVEDRERCYRCPQGYTGSYCQHRMTDCQDWKEAGYSDGVYWVKPAESREAFQVPCQMTWTRAVVMNRSDPQLDFYRTWAEYRDGFGEVQADLWLGLDHLQLLAAAHTSCLTLQYTLANSSFFLIRYSHFSLADEASFFSLHIGDPYFFSSLGDCLAVVNGQHFSTYDADHDGDVSRNCAERHHSGWWFGGVNCTACNPTGILRQPSDMVWQGDLQDVFSWPGLGSLAPHKVHMFVKRC